MLYIPADQELRYAMFPGAPLQPMAAHWAFTRLVAPPEPVPEPVRFPNVHGCIIYTRMPIARDTPDVLWRCKPHKDNHQAFTKRVLAPGSLACACPLGDTCIHEEQFLLAHPNALRVSLLEGEYRLGSWRATVRPSPAVRIAPNSAAVVALDGVRVTLQQSYDTDVILDVGAMVSPFSLLSTALFPRTMEPWRWFQRQEQIFEVPLATSELDIGDVRLHIEQLEPRHGVFGAIQAFSLLVMGSFTGFRTLQELSQLPMRVDVAKQVVNKAHDVFLKVSNQRAFQELPALDAFKQAPVRYIASKIWNALPDYPEQLPLGGGTPAVPNTSLLTKLFGETWKQWCYRMAYYAFHKLSPYTRTIAGAAIGASLTYALLKPAFTYARIRCAQNGLVPVVACPITRPFAYTADLHVALPSEDEIVSRLSVLPSVSAELARDIIRRISAEKGWKVKFSPEEIAAFVERVITEPGLTRLEYDKPGKCVNCKERPRTYRLLCKFCQRRMREEPPQAFIPPDAFVSYVGVLPIFSAHFTFPIISIRPGVTVKDNKKLLFDEHTDDVTVRNWYAHQDVRTSLRGRSTGPVFLGQRPKCFPRGHPTAVIGFLLRLGATPPRQAQWSWYARLLRYTDAHERYPKIEPESRDVFVSHFSGDKLQKMLEAEAEINAGNFAPIDPANPVVEMGGFTKAEKSNAEKFVDSGLKEKGPERPRFICCPKATFLFSIGPYTHAQTKWLSSQYTWNDHLFYAGCATPPELNRWLNKTIAELGSFITIADDISSCDASHSKCSMRYHAQLRAKLFRSVPWPIELLYQAEEHLSIRIGNFRATVDYVNGSGVSDTSFKNSALCIIIRLFAIAHAIRDLSTFNTEDELFAFINDVRCAIYTSASGDDGLTRLVNYLLCGTDLRSADARTRYEEMWGLFGFKVTVEIYSEADWRLATYLAMRPTYNGYEYEFTPEPARRLRNLYWQLDNSMHPVVWARSISASLLRCSGSNPILRPIAEFYLANTTGPIESGIRIFDNPNSVWHGYETRGGQVHERAIREMLIDYRVSAEDYDVFLGMLRSTPSVYVNFSCHFLQQVYRMES